MLSIGYRLHFEPHNPGSNAIGATYNTYLSKITSLDSGNGFTYFGDPNAWRLKKIARRRRRFNGYGHL